MRMGSPSGTVNEMVSGTDPAFVARIVPEAEDPNPTVPKDSSEASIDRAGAGGLPEMGTETGSASSRRMTTASVANSMDLVSVLFVRAPLEVIPMGRVAAAESALCNIFVLCVGVMERRSFITLSGAGVYSTVTLNSSPGATDEIAGTLNRKDGCPSLSSTTRKRVQVTK